MNKPSKHSKKVNRKKSKGTRKKYDRMRRKTNRKGRKKRTKSLKTRKRSYLKQHSQNGGWGGTPVPAPSGLYMAISPARLPGARRPKGGSRDSRRAAEAAEAAEAAKAKEAEAREIFDRRRRSEKESIIKEIKEDPGFKSEVEEATRVVKSVCQRLKQVATSTYGRRLGSTEINYGMLDDLNKTWKNYSDDELTLEQGGNFIHPDVAASDSQSLERLLEEQLAEKKYKERVEKEWREWIAVFIARQALLPQFSATEDPAEPPIEP
jgi:hypothetical protein